MLLLLFPVAACYCLPQLPAAHRMAGTRGAQLRQVCNDLKRICQHPFMLPEFEPEHPEAPAVPHPAGSPAASEAAAAEAENLAALLASSAKLQLLDSMLGQLREQGQQVMVMAHSPRVSCLIFCCSCCIAHAAATVHIIAVALSLHCTCSSNQAKRNGKLQPSWCCLSDRTLHCMLIACLLVELCLLELLPKPV